jgi:hypothetical protein
MHDGSRGESQNLVFHLLLGEQDKELEFAGPARSSDGLLKFEWNDLAGCALMAHRFPADERSP